MEPVETTRPPDVERPVVTNPPDNVEVAVEVTSKEPPEMRRPFARLAEVPSRPPENVEVAVEV